MKVKKCIIASAILILVVLLSNVLINQCFLNIYSSFGKINDMVKINLQLLYPDIYTYSAKNPTTPIYSYAKFDFSARGYFLSEYKWEGSLSSGFGRLSSSQLIESSYVKSQNYYSKNNTNIDLNILDGEDDQAVFEVVIGCDSIDYKEFISYYHSFYDYNEFKDIKLNWIGIKSSDKPEDVTIGVPGPLSCVVADKLLGTNIKRSFFEYGEKQKEYLINCLSHIENNSDVASRVEDSGLFGSTIINYKERNEYIKNNDLKVLGFFAYMNKSELINFINEEYYLLSIKKVM